MGENYQKSALPAFLQFIRVRAAHQPHVWAWASWSFASARSTAEFPAVKDPFQEVLCIHFAISSQVHTSCLLAEWIKRAERFFFRLAKIMSELASQIEKYSRPGSFPFLTMLVAQCSAHKGFSLGRSLLASLLGKCIDPFLPSFSFLTKLEAAPPCHRAAANTIAPRVPNHATKAYFKAKVIYLHNMFCMLDWSCNFIRFFLIHSLLVKWSTLQNKYSNSKK